MEEGEDTEETKTTIDCVVVDNDDEVSSTSEFNEEEEEEEGSNKETVEACLRREARERLRKSFELVFESCPLEVGKSLSRKERRQNKLNDASLRYGEITFDGFTKILERIKVLNNDNATGGTFVDLGSGTGKACIMAALSDNFSAVIGIEVLDKLHKKAKENKTRFKKRVDPTPSTEITFSRDDIIAAEEWTQIAKCVFTLCTCFCDELMDDLIKKLETCDKGTYVVSVTHPIISDKYKLLEHGKYKMSFGEATVFFHRKIM